MKHRWNTHHYEKYTTCLWRTDLHKLYPSESWAMYRTILKSKTCLDLGCGNGRDSYYLSKKYQVTGCDLSCDPENTNNCLFIALSNKIITYLL